MAADSTRTYGFFTETCAHTVLGIGKAASTDRLAADEGFVEEESARVQGRGDDKSQLAIKEAGDHDPLDARRRQRIALDARFSFRQHPVRQLAPVDRLQELIRVAVTQE